MSGTSGTPPQTIDMKKAHDGAQFLRLMGDDLMLGDDTPSLEALITNLLPRDGDGKAQFDASARDQAADHLIASMNELNRKGDLSPDAQNFIKRNFTDPALDSPAAVAKRLKNDVAQKDFWTILANGPHDFAVSYNQNELAQLRAMLNKLTPGLGNLLSGLIGGASGGASADWQSGGPNDKGAVLGALEQGFDTAMNGGPVSLARFWGKENKQDFEDKDVPFNPWNAPGNEEMRRAFFEGRSEGAYQFYDSDPEVYQNNFADMIVRRWEKTGVIDFETPEAKQAFIEYSEQLAVGGGLGEKFVATLEQETGLKISDPGARQGLIAYTQKLNPQIMDENEIAESVANYMAANTLSYGGDKDAIADAASHFVAVNSGAEYAQKMLRFAEDYNGIVLGHTVAPAAQQQHVVSAAAGAPVSLKATAVSAPTPTPTHTETIQAAKINVEYGKAVLGKLDADLLSVTTPDGKTLFKFADGFDVSHIENPGQGVAITYFDTKMTAEELQDRLSGGFTIEKVSHEGAAFGYYIRSNDGQTSFYAGPEALPTDKQSEEFKAQMQPKPEEEHVSRAPSTARSASLAPGA